MRKHLLFFAILLMFIGTSSGQTINCSNFCVTNISLDTIPGFMNVTIYNGDTNQVNYPIIQVVDSNNDTVGNPAGQFFFFAQLTGMTTIHNIPTTLSVLPPNFTCTVVMSDAIWDTSCVFTYPMNCFLGQPFPDCNNLVVSNYVLDTVAGTLDVTLFNNCINCASGIFGPVYCEMSVIQTMPFIDTLASSSCYCFMTPDNNNYKTYTLQTSITSLPPASDMLITFLCGGGSCDTLSFSPTLSVHELQSESQFVIFPNPTNNDFQIAFSGQSGPVTIQIFSASGRLVRTIEHYQTQQKISNLKEGIYFVKAFFDNTVQFQKLVIIE